MALNTSETGELGEKGLEFCDTEKQSRGWVRYGRSTVSLAERIYGLWALDLYPV